MPETKTERRIIYEYGPSPSGDDFKGVFAGFYTWEQLENFIREDRWGGSYRVTARVEREITYGDWTEVNVPD